MSNETMNGESPVRGWILYDDLCGFCQRWVPMWGDTLHRHRFHFAPLQADWVAQAIPMDRQELMQDLRLLLADGRLLSGADVYRYVMRFIGWAYPLYLFAVAPGTRRIFDWGYRTFADHRYQVSAACRLEPKPRIEVTYDEPAPVL